MRRASPLSAKPRLKVAQILTWADAYFAHYGRWPHAHSGSINPGPLLNWRQVDNALRYGSFGLPGGSSLAKLLAAERGVRSWSTVAPLTEKQILAWADAFRARHDRWPTTESGAIHGGENWRNVDMALRARSRGLPGGSSLAKLLASRRGHRHNFNVPPLTTRRILRSADLHRKRTGNWPTAESGPVVDAPGETWAAFNLALTRGTRGLQGKTSLAELLRRYRSRRNKAKLPRLREREILAWADAHKNKTGRWPNQRSKFQPAGMVDTWRAVDQALGAGLRGLRGGSSLTKLLEAKRGGTQPQER